MRITALVKHPDHVCCRYRLAAFRPFVEAAGHSLQFHPWPTTLLSRLLPRRALGQTDVLIIQRKLMPAWQVAMLRRITGTLIYDFDDAVFVRDSFSRRGPTSTSRARNFVTMVQKSNIVVAGNSYLREQAARHTDPEKVALIPTCVDPARYRLAEHRRGPLQLVWIGSSSTLRALERQRYLLSSIGRQCRDVRLKLVCDRFLDLGPLAVVPRGWSADAEAEELASADVGISLLPDDVWSRGKCGLKVLQYMAAGLPVVANPVGVQAQLVRHGESGFLVETEAEWVAAIERLRDDPDLRRRMGEAGRRRIEAEFSLEFGARLWLEHLVGQPSSTSYAHV